MKPNREDSRVIATRSALLRAFFDLVRDRSYDEFKVADIVELAGISRSTFYAHFSGKDALLECSIAGPFAVLADAMVAEHDETRLVDVLEHFWENRARARLMLAGSLRRKTAAVLARQLAQRLKSAGLARKGALILPSRLVAIQLAETLLAPVNAWLCGDSRCDARTLAVALRRVTIAAVGAVSRAP